MAEYKPYEESLYVADFEPVRITGVLTSDNFIEVDACVNVIHEARVKITEHPVELGANISDHTIVDPREFVLTGRISAVKPVKEGYSDDADNIIAYDAPDRVQFSWETLENAMRNSLLLTINTPLKIYENVLIEELRTSQDWRTVLVLDFTATFRELITVGVAESKLSEDEIAEGDFKDQSTPTNDRGDVQVEYDNSVPSRDTILGG